MDEFLYVKKAFEEEKPISQMVEHYGIDFLHKGLHTTPYIKDDKVSLQFFGWEIVLLKDGTYFINDTSGG